PGSDRSGPDPDSGAYGQPAECEPCTTFDHSHSDRRGQEVDPGEDLGGPQLRRASATPGPAEIYRGPAVRGAHPGDHPDTARVYRSLPGERQAVLSAGGLQGNRGRTAVFKLAVNN